MSQGWHNDSLRHANARSLGKAGPMYKKGDQKIRSELSERGIHIPKGKDITDWDREVNKKFKKAELKKTKTAYADSIGFPKGVRADSPEFKKWENKVYKKRILNWEGTSFMLPKELKSHLKIVGDYNEFDPDNVSTSLQSLERRFPGIKVQLGRESSPAVYIDPGTHDPNKIMDFAGSHEEGEEGLNMFNANEMDIMDHKTIYGKNYDWKTGAGSKTIKFNKPFIRLWWD